jgi:ATP-dependent RNA helicase SUPV3L1/SUV3
MRARGPIRLALALLVMAGGPACKAPGGDAPPRPDRVCPGDPACPDEGEAVLYAGAAMRDVTPEIVDYQTVDANGNSRFEPHPLGATGAAASVEDLLEAPHDRFKVDLHGRILWQDRVIGSLSRGQDLLHPEVTPADGSDLGAGARWRIQRRLRAWTRDMVSLALGPLRHPDTGSLSPAGRGLVYQLEQKLGTVIAATARPQLVALCPEDRKLLDRLGIRLGHRLVYVPSLLTPQAVHHRVVLCGLALGRGRTLDEPPAGAPSIPADPAVDREMYTAIGYPVFGPQAVRADIAEEVDGLLYRVARKGPFAIPPEVVRLLGCAPALVARIVQRFGYHAVGNDRFARGRKRRGRRA